MKIKFILLLTALASIMINQELIAGNYLQEATQDTVVTGPTFADQRLIELFIENAGQGNFEWAFRIYDKITYKNVLELQHAYMRALERTGRFDGIREKYRERLTSFPGHEPFREGLLFHEARERFEAAERRYQAEIARYERNKNTTTHALLMRELRILSGEFRQIRDIANQLHQINPLDRRYLKLLRGIYTRLNEPGEVARIERQLSQLEAGTN